MSDFTQAAAIILRTYGQVGLAWALVLVLSAVVWKLILYVQKVQTLHHETVKQLLQDHNRAQKEETRELVEAMMATSQSLQNMSEMLQLLITRARL